MVNRYMYLAFAQSVILPLAWVVVWYDLDTSAMSESAFMTFVVSLQLRTVENRVDRVVCMLVLVVLKTSPSWASPAPPWLPHRGWSLAWPRWSLTHGAFGVLRGCGAQSSIRQRPDWPTSARLGADVDHAGR